MPNSVDVFLVPDLAQPNQFQGRTVVVIDVLRATTTITHALAHGAQQVIPCLEVDQAKRIAAELKEPAVLGGERGGIMIPGFDLSNSPMEYTAERIGGKTIVFTTTNGTRALLLSRAADLILIGAFVNFSATCDRLSDVNAITLLCSGTGNEVTREDVLLAGALTVALSESHPGLKLNDQAAIAADAWVSAERGLRGARPLAEVLRNSRGGRNLIEIGQDADIEIAASLDRFDIVGVFEADSGLIKLP